MRFEPHRRAPLAAKHSLTLRARSHGVQRYGLSLPSPPAGKVPSRRKFTGMAQRKNATADEVEPNRRAPFTEKHNLAVRAQSIADRRYGRCV